ncbi:MAG: DUF4256 domain-containing protein [Spirochaetaceae bacterium]|nr:DUF4256 domain-containing protein [Spirochaetaceae bacterium]
MLFPNRIIEMLEDRFNENMNRHEGLEWEKIKIKIEENNDKFASLLHMELTGGEPDVIKYDKETDEYLFVDCCVESPSGRRSLCYDNEALEERKSNKPINSAINLAKEMGIEILTELQYRELQKLGEFDKKTSSWIRTPDNIRNLGGALFCDYRYDNVFVYHNGAESYYKSRGFRGSLTI